MTRKISTLLIVLIIAVFLVFLFTADQFSNIFQPAQIVTGDTYYVDINSLGGACDNSSSGTTITSPWCAISKADSTLQAGDAVYIRAGTYQETIRPARSGTAEDYITYANYNDEEVIITGVSDGVALNDRSYINIDGLKIMNVSGRWVEMQPNGHHHIIQNCYMEGAGAWAGIRIRDRADYNQILNNTLIATCPCSSPCSNGGPADNIVLWNSSYNLIEGNYFGYARHDAIDMQSRGTAEYNVVRNNIFQNKWHTNIAVWSDADHTLVEGNISVDAGEEHSENWCGSAGDRGLQRGMHSGLKVSSRYGIFRNNVLINNGLFSLQSGKDRKGLNNRIYSNTFFKNYRAPYSNTTYPLYGNIFKNNIWYNQELYSIYLNLSDPKDDNYFIQNNIFGAPIYTKADGEQTLAWFEAHIPVEWHDNREIDPEFVNPGAINDNDNGNFDPQWLHLQATSLMRDAGTFLTKTTNSGTDAKVIQVEDALYFYDGWGIEGEAGDLIQLEGQSTTARITDVNYGTNTITVNTNLTWNAGQGVSLAYQGTAPDIGAYEYEGSAPPPSYQCSDSIDNDSDGLIDYPDDPGCTSATDNDEYNAPEGDPLVLHFDMETLSGDGRIEDLSGSGNHGTIQGATWTSNGKYGNAYQFDGVNDYIDCGDIGVSRYTPYTVSLWAKLAAMPTGMVLDNVFQLKQSRGNNLWVYDDGDLGAGDLSIGGDGWERWQGEMWSDTSSFHHIVMVSPSEDQIELFFDGTSQGLKSTSIATSFPFDEVRWGYDGSSDRSFYGIIDDVRIYTRALTTSEIQDLYQGIPPTDTTPPAPPTGVGVQ